MSDAVNLERLLAASPYTEPVDLKKLRFIYEAVDGQAVSVGKPLRDLAVLEIGCGVGGITLPLATMGCRIRAIDIDEADTGALKAEAERRRLDNLLVSVEDVFRFDEPAGYDVVIMSELIEHVLDTERLIGIVRRHVAPEGVVVVTTPNGYGPYEIGRALNPWNTVRRWNWLRKLAGKAPYVPGAGRDHCQRFTKRRLLKAFAANSFRLRRFASSDSVLSFCRPLRRNRSIAVLDMRLADVLPHWMASGWYMVFEISGRTQAARRSSPLS